MTPSIQEHETIYSGPAPEPRAVRIPEPAADDVAEVEGELNAFIMHVFIWISGALLLSALFANYSDRWNEGTVFVVTSRILFLLVSGMLALAFVLSRKVGNMAPNVAVAALVGYSAMQGALFGLTYHGAYSTSLAPVYLVISVVFASLGVYGKWSGRDLTSMQSLWIGVALAPAFAALARPASQLQTITAWAACIGSWLMLALLGYHRDFLRDLPSSFDDDPKWEKAAAIGALQIYLDLVTIMVIVIQLRWLTSFFQDAKDEATKKPQP